MGILNFDKLEQFVVDGIGPFGSDRAALRLDSSALNTSADITYAEAGRWVIGEMESVNLASEREILHRIEASKALLRDLKACTLWPIAAHAHMQLIFQLSYQLSHILHDDPMDGGDMSIPQAARWADEEVMRVDLKDPFEIADRIAASAEKLSSEESCSKWPGSAYAHRKVVTDLAVFLKRTRGTVH